LRKRSAAIAVRSGVLDVRRSDIQQPEAVADGSYFAGSSFT
jgi:hypothetical protein